jgi:hypothetical protein
MTGWARFVVVAVIAGGIGLRAVPPNFTPPSDYVSSGQLPPAEASAALDAFRHAGPAQPAYLEFELQHLPRRGPKVVAHGRLWASRGADGSVIRIEIDQGARFLLQNGPKAQVWRRTLGSSVIVPSAEALQPGWELTAFDLQMPFLYWPQATGVTVSRVRGRPADVFLFSAPAGLAPLTAVRADLDSEYHAPVQIESLAGPERVLKTFSLLDVKNLNGQWLAKDLEVRDETTRNKTRLSFTGAALGLDLSETLFTPDGLGQSVAAPTGVQRW